LGSQFKIGRHEANGFIITVDLIRFKGLGGEKYNGKGGEEILVY